MRPLTAAHEKTWYSLPSWSGSPRSIHDLAVLDCRPLMSTTSLSAVTLPCLAKLTSSCGLGAAARSGGLPAATREVRIASSSLVASYEILMPVESVKGLTTAMNEACSEPDHCAITLTEPALWVPPVPHATAANMAARATTTARMRLEDRML